MRMFPYRWKDFFVAVRAQSRGTKWKWLATSPGYRRAVFMFWKNVWKAHTGRNVTGVDIERITENYTTSQRFNAATTFNPKDEKTYYNRNTKKWSDAIYLAGDTPQGIARIAAERKAKGLRIGQCP